MKTFILTILLFLTLSPLFAFTVPVKVVESFKSLYPTEKPHWRKQNDTYEGFFKNSKAFASIFFTEDGTITKKVETIELDDAPVNIAEDLLNHKLISIVRNVDLINHTSSYDTKSKIDKLTFMNHYDSLGQLETIRTVHKGRAIAVLGTFGLSIIIIVSFVF